MNEMTTNFGETFTGSALYGGNWATPWDEYGGDQGTLSLTTVPAPMGKDHISFSSPVFNITMPQETSKNQFWKFGEDQTLKAAEQYITGTYNSHYASENSKVQVLDIIDAIGDGVAFCRDNLIKYSSRFGKKNGMSKLDALKIIHYGILLYHFAGFNNETAKSNYETF